MAECSYARCVQQRRNIKRELQRWTKNMVHIVGLERIAEELMGRRKWKLYQESMSRSYLQPLNNNIKRTSSSEDSDYHHARTNNWNPQVDSDQDKDEAKAEINGNGDGGRAEKEEQKENEEKEAERLKDWTPEAKCYFCVDGKLDSEHTTHGVLSPRPSDSETSDSHSDSEVPTSLTPTSRGWLNNNHHHRPNVHHPATPPTSLPAGMTTIENVSMAALAVAALGGATSPGAPLPAAPHLPFYNPAVLTHNWYLANVARSFQTAAAQAAAAQQEVDKGSGSVGGEQPLDLSKGSSNSGEQKLPMANHIRLPTLDTKQIFKAKPRMSAVAGRRTYTEDELQAALRDIQSGKLGTRRAAVIYGIPRSTLRNKVYKLALERERENVLNSSTPLEEEVMDDDKELSGAEEEKEVEKALQGPLLSVADLFRFTGREQTPEALKHFFQKNKEGQDMWAGMDHSEVGPLIQNLLLTSQNILTNQAKPPDGSSVLNHMIPDFVKRFMAEEQLLKMQQNNNGDNEKLMRPSPSNSVITKIERPKSESDMETEDSSSNVILKIPSFKPTSSKNGCDIFRNSMEPTGSMISPPITTDSSNSPPILPSKAPVLIRDVIAQSISQKFQEPTRTRPVLDMEVNRGGFTPPLGSGVSVIKSQQELGRQYQQQQSQQSHQSGKPPGTTGGKGTRPKRGKYRNYDRDSLVEAVRAVQRGEMSVHRAGSYYGVPHSTLEYKVKERHLMRPRKRDPKPNPVDEKIASLKQNDLRNAQVDKLKQPLLKSPQQKFPPTSPNGMKLPMFEGPVPSLTGYSAPPPPFPFWPHPGFPHIPLEYPRNPAPFSTTELFASQMMQKLQEESSRTFGSQSKATPSSATTNPALVPTTRQMAESLLEAPGTSNGSFLDGIIRSSLESGVPTDKDQKTHVEEEERNVARLSNKALLDQLCRNSRRTPLSKTEGGNSSGDEGGRRSNGSPLNFTTCGNSHEDNNDDDSSSRYEKDNSSEVHTIELSNDSNASSERKPEDNIEMMCSTTTKPRIYLKQDLVKPENLKPEMLVRFCDVIQPMETDHNGMNESAPSSASENDAQD